MLFLVIILCKDSLACVYPPQIQNSTWYDNARGVLSFTDSEMSGFDIQSYSSIISDWDCFTVFDGLIISRGKMSVNLFGSNHDVYVCMEMTKITVASYKYYLMSDEEPNANNERVYIIQSGTVINDPSVICQTNSPMAPEEYNVMVKQGIEIFAKQWCPSVLLGSYYYTYSSSSGSSCGIESEWDVCTYRNTMTFNYTRCPTTVAFSDSEVFCIASVTSHSIIYLTVFNNGTIDSVNYHRFACLAILSSGTTLNISLQKLKCDKDQSPSILPTGGNLASLTPYYTCPFNNVDDTNTLSASLLGAAIAGCLVVVMVTIVSLLYIKFKKKIEIHPEQPRGFGAYFVKEFTFERFSKKLDSNKGHNDSVCVSVSALNCEPDDIEDIPCVGSAMSKK